MDNNQLNNELDIKFDLNIDNNMDFNLDTDFGSDFGLDVDWGDKLQVDIPDITVSMPQTEIPEQPQPKVYEPPKAVTQSAYAYPGAGKQGLNSMGQRPQQQYGNVKPHLQQQSYEAQQTKSWTGANGRSQSAGNQSNAGTYNQYSFDAVFKGGNSAQSRTPIEGTDRVMYTRAEYRTEQPQYNQSQYNQPQYKRAQEYMYHNHNNGGRREYMSSAGGQNNNYLQTGIKRAAIIFVGVVVLMIILMIILTI